MGSVAISLYKGFPGAGHNDSIRKRLHCDLFVQSVTLCFFWKHDSIWGCMRAWYVRFEGMHAWMACMDGWHAECGTNIVNLFMKEQVVIVFHVGLNCNLFGNVLHCDSWAHMDT